MDEYEELETVLEEPFERIEEQASMHTQARMERIEQRLLELERELDRFLQQAHRTPIG
jgi:hypothetical protein